MANGRNNIFIYMGQPLSSIPKYVTHVRVDSNVTVVPREAFCNCTRLLDVQLNEGLTTIERWAFQNTNLLTLVMPSTFEVIGLKAFERCPNLNGLHLNEGLRVRSI